MWLDWLNKKIILASASQRRLEILESLKFENIVVFPSTFEENLSHSQFQNAKEYVLETAKLKALDVYQRLQHEDYDLIISADTVIECDGIIIEKPRNRDYAKSMLRKMISSKYHSVLTAIVLLQKKDQTVVSYSNVEETKVEMKAVSEEELEFYLDFGEWKEKAGGYGYQAMGKILIQSIQGCYYNLVGFPIHLLFRLLLEIKT